MKFFLQKLAIAILTLWLVATLTFLGTKAVGGESMFGEGRLDPIVQATIRKQWGLDQPLWKQYLIHMGKTAQLDSMPSRRQRGKTMRDVLKEYFPASLRLGWRALVLSIVIGVPVGIVCAVYHNKFTDQSGSTLALLGVSVPSFVLASLCIFYLCRYPQVAGSPLAFMEGWFPAADWGAGFWRLWIPAACLAAFPFAAILRLTRASMLEALREDYVRTARAKGASPLSVVCKHALRNSLVSVVTYLGPVMAALLTGSLVVERIFALPGLGKFFVQSVQDRDMPLILGTAVFYSALLIGMNLLVDSIYPFLNPRLRDN